MLYGRPNMRAAVCSCPADKASRIALEEILSVSITTSDIVSTVKPYCRPARRSASVSPLRLVPKRKIFAHHEPAHVHPYECTDKVVRRLRGKACVEARDENMFDAGIGKGGELFGRAHQSWGRERGIASRFGEELARQRMERHRRR